MTPPFEKERELVSYITQRESQERGTMVPEVVMSEWKEVTPTGFWARLKYELMQACLGEFGTEAEYINENGVRRFIRASDGQSRTDVPSLLRCPNVQAHLRAMDRIVKSPSGASGRRFMPRKRGKRKKRR